MGRFNESTAFQADVYVFLFPAAPAVQPVTNPSGVVASSHNFAILRLHIINP
ncbi:MAG: hypothetical protein MJZ69_11205 [Bacteroidaceae bacterium]|nr:hypothetical protein [Bacteroidaceae bacterium]